jgi:putative endopeptidase
MIVGLMIGFALLPNMLFAQGASSDERRIPIDPRNFDTTVKPTEDFYQYANGGWIKNNPIPADQSRWGSFNELQENNFKVLHGILEDAARATDAPKGSNLQKVGDFYASGMDSAAIEAAGIKPLTEELGKIEAMKTATDLHAEIAHMHTFGAGVPFAFFVAQDAKKSTDVIAQFSQGGLGLPDRDYYTKDDENSKKIRDQYLAHVVKMFQLLGDNEEVAGANAATVMAIETRLAKASMTRVERRDPEAIYHKMVVGDLNALTPDFSWTNFFTNIGLPNPGNINVGQPNFLKEVGLMIKEVPLKDWKAYFRWHLVDATADYLSSAFVNEKFEFNGKVLTGAKELRARWKRCLQTVDGQIGEALGQLYVEKAFPPAAKARALELVNNLRSALRDRIQTIDWMGDETKKQASKKLDAFQVKIGYPDKWRDYSSLMIDRSSFVMNVLRANQFEFNRNLNQIGKPVDRTEWGMTPPTVNAYYNPTMNEIVFPAGILQPPFFDFSADDAVNYGGIGAVIGHEMTHGFDDQGRKFDAEGNLKEWWTKEDADHYLTRATMVEKQFNGYVGIDTQHVNGKLTLGENIADLGGLTIAYIALHKAFDAKGKQQPIDGFTPEQRFFLSWGQIWRNNTRPEAMRLRLNTDPHSPGRFRCIGPISNMTEFMDAFNAKEGSPMVRSTRAKIW